MVQIKTSTEKVSEEVKKAREGKEEVSMILTHDTTHQWIDANKHKPGIGESVIFRIENRTTVQPFAEDEKNIIYAEDEKVGRYVRDIRDPEKGHWVIDPPFTKYDYSPLSFQDHLLDGSVVTHWAYLMDGELEGWKTRLDPIGDYAHLSISVSPDYEEIVYKALLNGASWIARSINGNIGKEGYEMQSAMYAALNDLQFCIDGDVHISKGKIEKNHSISASNSDKITALYGTLSEEFPDKAELSEIINGLKALDEVINMGEQNAEVDEDDE